MRRLSKPRDIYYSLHQTFTVHFTNLKVMRHLTLPPVLKSCPRSTKIDKTPRLDTIRYTTVLLLAHPHINHALAVGLSTQQLTRDRLAQAHNLTRTLPCVRHEFTVDLPDAARRDSKQHLFANRTRCSNHPLIRRPRGLAAARSRLPPDTQRNERQISARCDTQPSNAYPCARHQFQLPLS